MHTDELDDHLRRLRRRRMFEPAADRRVEIAGADVTRLLPHRTPFLFVERITQVDLDAGHLLGTRVIPADDPVFEGHFPGHPVFPGVLQMEMMGQHGICLLALTELGTTTVPPDAAPKDVRALKIHQAVFVREIGPADELEVLVGIVDANSYTAIAAGQILCRSEICSYGLMEMYFAA